MASKNHSGTRDPAMIKPVVSAIPKKRWVRVPWNSVKKARTAHIWIWFYYNVNQMDSMNECHSIAICEVNAE